MSQRRRVTMMSVRQAQPLSLAVKVCPVIPMRLMNIINALDDEDV